MGASVPGSTPVLFRFPRLPSSVAVVTPCATPRESGIVRFNRVIENLNVAESGTMTRKVQLVVAELTAPSLETGSDLTHERH
jgi:hypothetical protein